MLQKYSLFDQSLADIHNGKVLINTLNAHCFNVAQSDMVYKEALLNSDILLPDGISIVWAIRCLTGQKLEKIAGEDLFFYEMKRLQQDGGKCFFLGSTDTILNKIRERIAREYPNVMFQSYSPPYKTEFSKEDNTDILNAINSFKPNVLFVGMTAPKQEKWAYQHFKDLNAGHICCIGAVFDYYAGTHRRAPKWLISMYLEWLYRLIREPRRMWPRYLIGNIIFIWYILKEKFGI